MISTGKVVRRRVATWRTDRCGEAEPAHGKVPACSGACMGCPRLGCKCPEASAASATEHSDACASAGPPPASQPGHAATMPTQLPDSKTHTSTQTPACRTATGASGWPSFRTSRC